MYLPASHLNCHHSLLNIAAWQGQGHGHWISRHLSELSSWYSLKTDCMPAAKFCSKRTSNCITVSLFAARAVLVPRWFLTVVQGASFLAGEQGHLLIFIYLLLSFKQSLNQGDIFVGQHGLGREKQHSVKHWAVLYSYEKPGSQQELGHGERMSLGGVEWWRWLYVPKIDTALDADPHDTQIRMAVGVCLTGCPCRGCYCTTVIHKDWK